MHRPDHRRAGMTLVELLVVVAIIGLLAVTVLPNLSNTAETRRTRETARAVSTWVSKAQSRAIGRTEWAGFWILPVNAAAPYAAAIDLQLADVPEVYRGESLQSQVMVRAPTNPNPWTNFYRELHQPSVPSQQAPFVTDIALQAGSRTLQTGDLIRFDGCGAWFELFPYTTTPQVAFGVRFRGRGNVPVDELSIQNSLNTPWPLEAVPHSYEVLRQPVRSGATFSFADGRCIDLYWSGRQTNNEFKINEFKWFGLAAQTAKPVGVLFDATGRVRELVVNNTREPVEGAIYLLVGRADRAGQGFATLDPNDDSVGANWQYGDSYWIAIDPNSGMAKVAEVAINSGNPTGDVVGSQSFIRSLLVTGGR